MFSMTKFVTSIACHQLVDKQLISLDDPAVISQHLPEVSSMQILEGYDGDQPRLKPVTTPITLSMLLSHSAGMAYAWPTQPSLVKWRQQTGKGDYFANRSKDPEAYVQPLVFEPGTSYTYGVGVDWAGFLIERVTGKSLEEYFKVSPTWLAGGVGVGAGTQTGWRPTGQSVAEPVIAGWPVVESAYQGERGSALHSKLGQSCSLEHTIIIRQCPQGQCHPELTRGGLPSPPNHVHIASLTPTCCLTLPTAKNL